MAIDLISSESKLRRALAILEKELFDKIISIRLFILKKRLSFELEDGIKGFIQFNDYGEYGYNLQFSSLNLDRCRFDNFDSFWDVSTKPHHFHPRYEKKGQPSPMNGDPEIDIPRLVKHLRTGDLKSAQFRF